MSPPSSPKAPMRVPASGRATLSCKAAIRLALLERHARQEKNALQRYKDMESSEGKFLKLEHCWEMLEDRDKWKLIDQESPPKRGFLTNMDEDEDDDGLKNLNKPDGDKKTKENIKRKHEATSLWDKIDAMVQSNEVMLVKSLETKVELAEKKARENQER
ncbi:Lactation elevated protein 1 [Hordeum vulgare]|nr:Lactation elevated protein 1 [Hordeum vulgare]